PSEILQVSETENNFHEFLNEIDGLKEKKAKKLKIVVEKPKPILKVGDRVRMSDGKAVGSIDKIEKNKAVVNYGVFTSNVSLNELEFVESEKK
ncbi:MAG TPA: DNA mismatch repair protein MutS, partial [Flavobacterium sp.]|nr:DNA mismatch repair protein MutS [Flavobacterium sp.]